MVKVGDYATTSKGYTGFVTTVGAMPMLDGGGRFIMPVLVSIALGSRNGRPIGVTVPVYDVIILPDPTKK